MKLIRLSLKNAIVKWWRSLTLGFFIFSTSFVLVLSGSFIATVKNKVDNVISNGMTGHIQIRSDRTTEGDMASQYSPGWDAIKPMDGNLIGKIKKTLDNGFPDIRQCLLTRQSVFLTGTDKREETMLIGIDPSFTSYKDAFLLTSGRYIDPAASDEILLTEEQASAFNVKTGGSIRVTTKNMYGLNSGVDLKVVGTGNFVMLSLFSYKACYTESSVVRKLVGMNDGEATDMVLLVPDSSKVQALIGKLSEIFQNGGIKNTVTSEEQLKSEDLEVTELKFDDSGNNGVLLSGFSEMGETFRGIGDTMSVLLNFLVIFLAVIVSILIINLVYLTGIERFREIGTLRAVGFSRPQVIRIFMGEILSVSLLSALLGVLISAGFVLVLGRTGISSPIPAMDYIMGKTLNLEMDLKSVIFDLIIIAGFSFAASFYPAYKACSVDPAQTLRAV